MHREQAQREGLVVRHPHLGGELLALAQQVEPLGRAPRDEAQPAAEERGAREIWGDMGRYGEMQGDAGRERET